MSTWPALEDGLSDVIDDHLGDLFEHWPMAHRTVNERASPDGTRPVTNDIQAIFSDRALLASGMAGRNRRIDTGWQAEAAVTTTNPYISIDLRRLGGVELRKGDHVRRLVTGAVYEIAEVRPDGQGRVRADLAAFRMET